MWPAWLLLILLSVQIKCEFVLENNVDYYITYYDSSGSPHDLDAIYTGNTYKVGVQLAQLGPAVTTTLNADGPISTVTTTAYCTQCTTLVTSTTVIDHRDVEVRTLYERDVSQYDVSRVFSTSTYSVAGPPVYTVTNGAGDRVVNVTVTSDVFVSQTETEVVHSVTSTLTSLKGSLVGVSRVGTSTSNVVTTTAAGTSAVALATTTKSSDARSAFGGASLVAWSFVAMIGYAVVLGERL